MKKIVCVLLVFISFLSCSTIVTWFKPKYFTYLYDGKYTGIDTLLSIDGYFYSDSTHNTVLLYRDGSIAIMYGLEEDKNFDKKKKKEMEYKITWGNYQLNDDTIKAQLIYNYGGTQSMQTGFRNYIIRDNSEIEYYSKNEEKVKIILHYHPYPDRLDSTHWAKNHKWFWKDKDAYKQWKEVKK